MIILVGLKRTHDEIAEYIKNPATGKPISRKTLDRHYRRELKSTIALNELSLDAWESLRQLVKEKHWQATLFVLSLAGLKPPEEGAEVTIKAKSATAEGAINVVFKSAHHEGDPPPAPHPKTLELEANKQTAYNGPNYAPRKPEPYTLGAHVNGSAATPRAYGPKYIYHEDAPGRWLRRDANDENSLWDRCNHGPEKEDV